MNTQRAEQNGDNDSIFGSLAHIDTRYFEITQPDGAFDYFL
jgi:hypothetical protein